jgi:outer membrane protein assembly factor BamB
VAADSDAVYATDAADRVTARRRSDGVSLWSNERLLNRRLSAPAVVGPTVVFGDLEGQVHFLSRSSGEILLRLPTDGSPVVGTPTLSDTTLLVATEDGGLFAFRPE